MSRQKTELVTCDRCKRQEIQPISATPRTEPEFSLQFAEEKLIFQDMCFRCRTTVKNYVNGLKEWDRELVPLFRPVDEVQAAPLQPAPDYSPPKPHSTAAAKK